ncbi:MAG: hypothetical protein PHT29_05955 [Eubacteriales bacterium]|jgi:hypothetical protein|nr:hypothetical protein [Eubacteriales bacterium]MDD3290412.1 hypothetical protein [Eubacteriales bacterium]MDD3863643.1 hypothetical protein [Eubacteriales bacterium]MDD4444550.1 hypothetical protein [Eubacteriales bacterium]
MSDPLSGVEIAAKVIAYALLAMIVFSVVVLIAVYFMLRLSWRMLTWPFGGGCGRFAAGCAVGSVHGIKKLMKSV